MSQFYLQTAFLDPCASIKDLSIDLVAPSFEPCDRRLDKLREELDAKQDKA